MANGASPILPLSAGDIDQLRLGWWSRFNGPELNRVLTANAGLSVWCPSESEYLIAGSWRNRPAIVHVVELVAVRNSVALLQAAIDQARLADRRLFLAIEATEKRRLAWYQQCGLEQIEEVVTYERGRSRNRNPNIYGDLERIMALDDLSLSELVKVDHEAFPWLWQNDPLEFHDYLRQAGVEIYLIRDGGEPAAYIGMTMYPSWGHIDRVAVRPAWQGRGLGGRLTEFAIERLSALGANTIGLSTQSRNIRSQGLYERLGFRRKPSGEYRIYGTLLSEGDSIDDLVLETH